jgi:hypothetical protein
MLQTESNQRILRHIAKLLRLAADERGNEHQRAEAKAKAEKLAVKHGIDLSEVRTDGEDRPDCNVHIITRGSGRLAFHTRCAALLVAEYLGAEITSQGPRIRFTVKKPGRPEVSADVFEFVEKHLWDSWRKFEKLKRAAGKSPLHFFFLGVSATKPCRRSYMSGMFHGMRQSMKSEQAQRARLEQPGDTGDDQVQRAVTALLEPPPPPEPFVPPPPNPLALAIREKVSTKRKSKRSLSVKPSKPEKAHKAEKESPSVDRASYSAGFTNGVQTKLNP